MNVEFCEDNSSTSKKMRFSCLMLKLEKTLHFLSGITFIHHANLGQLIPLLQSMFIRPMQYFYNIFTYMYSTALRSTCTILQSTISQSTIPFCFVGLEPFYVTYTFWHVASPKEEDSPTENITCLNGCKPPPGTQRHHNYNTVKT